MKIRKVPISTIRLAAYNPRKKLVPADAAYQQIRRSIKEFGLVDTLVWNERTGNLVGGHQRLQVLKDLGHKAVTVSVVNLDAKREKVLNVALNKIAGKFDEKKLSEVLGGLDDDDLHLTGFDEKELAGFLDKSPDQSEPRDIDSVPTPGKKIITKRGDVWELGAHRIMCGDSTSEQDVRTLMAGEAADMVFTDPPYGVDYQAASNKHAKIRNDEKRGDDLVRRLLLPALRQAMNVTKDEAAFYIWHASTTREDFAAAMRAVGLEERQYIIWAKNTFVMGHADYQWAHEPCFYAGKVGHRPAFYGDRTQQTVWTAILDQAKSADQVLVNIANGVMLTDGSGGQIFIQTRAPKGKRLRTIRIEQGQRIALVREQSASDLWQVAKDSLADHPTQKPVELAVRAIENSSAPDHIVLDLFGGTGCTIMGAEQTGRRSRAMEIEPGYVDQAVERWERFTGKKANLCRNVAKVAA